MDNIQQLKQWIDGSDRIVFFGGAGVSTESGIPDFRSVDGLYNQKYDYPPETILSHSFFMAHPEEYYKFHRDKLVVDGAKPNRAHLRLAELEREGKLQAVITQNIDGLHQAAGSKNVLELHGSIHRCYCMRCGRPYPAERVNHGTGVPHCDCGGIIRPDIVFYEECLDDDVVSSIFSPSSAGTNALLRDGRAKAVCTAEDLFGTLGLSAARPAPPPKAAPQPLSENERLVLSCMSGRTQGIEELGVRSGLPTAALLGVLMRLELSGRVTCLPGKRYILR